MKKSRRDPLTCMCRCNDKRRWFPASQAHNNTRHSRVHQSPLHPDKNHERTRDPVRCGPGEVPRIRCVPRKLEYEDIAKIARENGMSLEEVKELVEKQRVNVKSKEELILALHCFLHCIDNHRDKKNQHPTSHGKKLLSCTYHNE